MVDLLTSPRVVKPFGRVKIHVKQPGIDPGSLARPLPRRPFTNDLNKVGKEDQQKTWAAKKNNKDICCIFCCSIINDIIFCLLDTSFKMFLLSNILELVTFVFTYTSKVK